MLVTGSAKDPRSQRVAAHPERTVLQRVSTFLLGCQTTVVYTAYKVGSTTLFNRLCTPRLCAGGHVQVITEPPPRVAHFAIKAHSGEVTLQQIRDLIDRPIDRVMTLVRPIGELYLSAFFQNITDADYPYHFGTREAVLSSPIDAIVSHFMRVDWDSFAHLRPEVNRSAIAEYCGVEYEVDEVTLERGRVYAGRHGDEPVVVAVAGMGVLSDEAAFRAFLAAAKLPAFLRWQVRGLSDSNRSASKWYADVYEAVRQHPEIVDYLGQASCAS